MMSLIPAENWEYDLGDVLTGLASVATDDRGRGTLYIEGVGECTPTRSARVAIYTAIKVLDLSPGSRIGVPLYCCPVVFKAIEAAECKHCFIDVDFETCCVSAKDLDKKKGHLDALIAVHMFGNTCDIPALFEIMSGKPIIEDCAQSIGSTINGRMTGTLGTVGAFSFRSGKYLSVGEGGALFSNDPTINQKLSSATSRLPKPTLSQELKHLIATYTRTKLRTRPLYGLLGYPLWQYYNKKVHYSSKSPIAFSRSFKSDASAAIKRLNRLTNSIRTQREYANIFMRELQLNANMYCSEIPGAFYNRYLFPITLDSTIERDGMITYLLDHGIGPAKPYHDIATVAAKYYGYKGDCPVSEQIADRILVLPNYYTLKEQEILDIARIFNKGLDAISQTKEH